jgi:hypothetical protein
MNKLACFVRLAAVLGVSLPIFAAMTTVPDKDSIVITSNPSGATVTMNRKVICVTPCSYKLGEYAFNARKLTMFSKRLMQPLTLHVALDGFAAKDAIITQPRLWVSMNRRNSFTYFIIPGQSFSFMLDKATNQAKAVTNADIVSLWTAGLGDAVIVEKINGTATDFQLEIGDLAALHQAGISDAVIQAMVHKSSAPSF